MPRAKVGKRYIIVKDFRKYPKSDYTENFLRIDSVNVLYNDEGDLLSFVTRSKMPRLADKLPKVIKRGNDLLFPIPDDHQVIKLRSEGIIGVFQYRKKIYAITFPIYENEAPE